MSGAVQPMKAVPLRQVQDVKSLLMNDNARQQLAMVAAKHMNPERMMRVVANAIRTTPKLQQAEPMSFLGALMHCAALGLEPNTPLGHAYLIPFDNKRKFRREDGSWGENKVTEVQVVIGYKGFLDLARRSGQVVSIHSDVVYSDDELFSHEYGSNQHLRHKPGPREGEPVGAYCHVKLRLDEDTTAEGHVYLNAKAILRIRDQFSQGWKTAVKFGKTADSPWTLHRDAMWAKTAVRAMANRGELPMSIEFMQAMDQDDKRMDYRAFAMDPTIGAPPEIPDGEPDDGEYIEPEPPKQLPDQKPGPDLSAELKRAEQRAEREKEPVQTLQTEASQRQQAQPTQDTPAQGSMFAEEQDWSQDSRLKQFLADVESIGEADAMGMWEADLEKIKAKTPDLHAAMMAAAAQAANRR